MARLAAALEHLPPTEKAELGTWALVRLQDPATTGGPWAWALGRLGARAPIYGSIHKTVPPELAAEWLGQLLKPPAIQSDGALFAVAQLARLTGDRARDLEEALRERALAALQAAPGSASGYAWCRKWPPWKRRTKRARSGTRCPWD